MIFKNKKNVAAGFTITELMVATVLGSIFFLAGASVVTQLFTFQKDVSQRLMDDFSVVSFHRTMIGDLEGSYWGRLGAFSCPSSQKFINTASTAKILLQNDGDEIEFVKSDVASAVGLVPGSEDLAVADLRKINVGDYVLLTMVNSNEDAGIFKVKNVDAKKSQLTVLSASMEESGSECRNTTSNRSVASFFSGSTASNIIMTRVSIVKYFLKEKTLYRQTWPGPAGAEKIVDGVQSVTLNSSWTTSSDNSQSTAKLGHMAYKIILDLKLPTMVGGNQTIRQQKVIDAKYDLNAFEYINQYTSSGAPPATLNFPTCSVNFELLPGALSFNPSLNSGDPDYRDVMPVVVRAVLSQPLASATIDVSFVNSGGSSINCFKHDPANGPLEVNGAGIRGSFSTVLAGATGVFDSYICAVRGSVVMNANMTYYDTGINAMKSVTCSTVPIETPTEYRFSNTDTPRCGSVWADIRAGGAVTGNASGVVSYGPYGVDMTRSCKWSDDNLPGATATGIGSSCYFWDHPGATLERVFLRPYRLIAKRSNGSNFFSGDGAYINCN